jgi:ABC-type transport system involved in multi-copper enzyme maturation permease subunit
LNLSVPVGVSRVDKLLKVVFGDSPALLFEDVVEEVASFIPVERSIMVGVVFFVDFGQPLTEEPSFFGWDIVIVGVILLACTAAHAIL